MNQTDQLLFIVKMITEHHLIATTILLILLTQLIKWILFISNINNKNIYIEFYKKQNDNFELIDWTRVFDEEFGCGIDFNSRFPPLNIGNTNQVLQGKLRYGMVSYGFENVIRNDVFKLKIYIMDRALNLSNVIETPEVTLQEIMSD